MGWETEIPDVVAGQPIESAWGNEIRDKVVHVVTTFSGLPADADDGSIAYVESDDTFWRRGNGAWTSLLKMPQIVVITATGAFAKATYPGIGGVRVRLVGGGGGGSGNGAGNNTGGAGGGGGGYAETFVAAVDLAASETVTIGAAGIAATGLVAGGNGGATSFGAHAAAAGGTGGSTGGFGGPPGSGTAGQLRIDGGYGGSGSDQATPNLPGGHGGNSMLGYGGRGGAVRAADVAGTAGTGYGSGGGGGHRVSTPLLRGAGAPGAVIVDVLF